MSDQVKGRLFVSYSRQDIDFADVLVAELERLDGIQILIDRAGIAHGEDWQTRLGQLIFSCDTVVFILSPASIESDICAWEVDEAKRLFKRIIPVLWRPVDFKKVPPALGAINAVPFHGEHAVSGYRLLVEALKSDLDWLREHTRLGERVAEWEAASRGPAFLLRGSALKTVQQWLRNKPATAPDLTIPQREYLQASEEEEARLLSDERQRANELERARVSAEEARATAEEARAAAETARLKETAAARRVVRVTRFGLIAALTLAAAALFAGWRAIRSQAVAETQTILLREELRRTEIGRARFLTNLSDQRRLNSGDATLAYLLGVEAFTSHRSEGVADAVPEAATAYLTAAARLYEKRVIRHDASPGLRVPPIIDRAKGRLATFSGSNIVIWDVARVEAVVVLRGHTGRLVSALFSPDGTTLFSQGEDGPRVWDVERGRELARIPKAPAIRRVLAREVRPGTALLALSDKRLAWFDWRTGAVTATTFQSAGLPSVFQSKDRSRFLLVDDRITSFESASGNRIVDFELDRSATWGISPDARYVALSTGTTSMVDIVDARTGARHRLPRHAKGVSQIAFVDSDVPGQDVVVSKDRGGKILLHRIKGGATIGQLQTPASLGGEIRISSDGQHLLLDAASGDVWLWRFVDLSRVPLTLPSAFVARSAGFIGEADAFIVVPGDESGSKKTLVFERRTGRLIRTIDGPLFDMYGAQVSPDHTAIVPTWSPLERAAPDTIEMWRLEDIGPPIKIGGASSTPMHGEWLAGSLVTLSRDGLVRIVSARPTASEWEITKAGPRQLRAVSADGRRVFAVDDERRPTQGEIRDAGSGRLITTINLPPVDEKAGLQMFYAVFSPDGRRLITGSHDKSAIIWNAETGARLADLKGHKDSLIWISVSPDGKTIATSDYESNAARTWRMDTGAPLRQYPHAKVVEAAVFHPVQPWLLTTSWDHTARLWNVETGEALGTYRHFDEPAEDRWVRGAAFNADGSRLLTAYDEFLIEWNTTTFDERDRFTTDFSSIRTSRPFYAFGGQTVGATTIDRRMELWDARASPDMKTSADATKLPQRTISDPWIDNAALEPLSSLLLRDRFLISTSPAQIWDLKFDRLLLELPAGRALFASDGRVIATEADGRLRSWRLGHLLDTPQSLAPRCLTQAERAQFFLENDPPAWCITGPGRVDETDPDKWAPLWPYDTEQWRRWLIERRSARQPRTPRPSVALQY